MNTERPSGGTKLPVDVSELGELRSAELECPGVYFVVVETEIELNGIPVCDGYYLVLDYAPISAEVRRNGKPLQNGEGLVFSLNQGGGGSKIVEYEIFKYRVAHHLPLPEGESLHECAVYGAELYPEYFGVWPAPLVTPWGYTTRCRTLASGIYWLETDQCEETLAVFAPVWQADLSKNLLRHARQTDYDREHGIDSTLGYQFFSPKASCIAIFELLETRPEWITEGRIDLPALMNAIWENWPEYAMSYNAHEQAGLNDGAGLLLRSIGIDVELDGSEEHMIRLTPGAGTDFLRW